MIKYEKLTRRKYHKVLYLEIIENFMQAHTAIKIAKFRYIIYRIYLRIFMGKRKRDLFIKEKKIWYFHFLPLFYGNRILKSHEGFKAVPRLMTDDFSLLFFEREEEIKEHFKMNPGETFVDIGANVGYYSLLIAKENPDMKIISIEAHPDNFAAMNKNFEVNNFKNIISLNKAITSESGGKVRLYEHWLESGIKNTGTFNISNKYNSKSFVEVNCDTLDNLLKFLSNTTYVIKIDIEGEEANALLGAKDTLKSTRKIIVEIHNDDSFQNVKEILLFYKFNVEVVKSKMTFLIGTRHT